MFNQPVVYECFGSSFLGDSPNNLGGCQLSNDMGHSISHYSYRYLYINFICISKKKKKEIICLASWFYRLKSLLNLLQRKFYLSFHVHLITRRQAHGCLTCSCAVLVCTHLKMNRTLISSFQFLEAMNDHWKGCNYILWLVRQTTIAPATFLGVATT